MAVRKLYGNLDSTDTLRALISIYEHEIDDDLEFIPIDLKSGETQTSAFLSLNPFGEVPVFQDDDLTLFESRAIMRYISHAYCKAGKEQVFEEPKLQGIAATWIDVEDHVFGPPSTKLMIELLDKPNKGLQTDEAVVAEEEAKLAKVLDSYEERLQKFDYLGGHKFTSADLTHFPKLYFLFGTPLKRLFLHRPRVHAWSQQILSRPSATKVIDMVHKFKASINEI